MLQGKRITLIVSGGIAAFKSCEAARLLMKAGAEVQTVLTVADIAICMGAAGIVIDEFRHVNKEK